MARTRINGKLTASLIDLSSLASFTPAGQLGSSGYNWLSVTNGAILLDANLTQLDNTGVTVDGAGILATNQWYSLTDSSLWVTGGSYNSAFAGLSNINGTSISVQGGAQVSMPMVGGFTEPQNASSTWAAQGPGSTLSLAGLEGFGINANNPQKQQPLCAGDAGRPHQPVGPGRHRELEPVRVHQCRRQRQFDRPFVAVVFHPAQRLAKRDQRGNC